MECFAGYHPEVIFVGAQRAESVDERARPRMRSLRHLESQPPRRCMWPIIAWLALAWSPVSCFVLPSHQGRSLSAAPLVAPTLAHKTTRTPDRNLATIAARHFVVRMSEDQASADARLKAAKIRNEAAKRRLADATDRRTFVASMLFAMAAQIQADAPDSQAFIFIFVVPVLVGMGMSVISWRNDEWPSPPPPSPSPPPPPP